MSDLAQVLADLREEAAGQDRQIAARGWLTTADLAERWNVDTRTVRAIPRQQLPYLEFGRPQVRRPRLRRYDPADVATYEQAAKQAQEQAQDEGSAA